MPRPTPSRPPSCSWRARRSASGAAGAGLVLLQTLVRVLPPATLLGGLVSQAKGNGHISREDLLELALRPGMFFQSGVEQVEVLRGTNPRAALAAFAGKPVLFVNGSLDHRDGERVWLAAAGPRAQLITYEGGDHFFSHDSRFAQRLADDVAAFCARNELLLPTG